MRSFSLLEEIEDESSSSSLFLWGGLGHRRDARSDRFVENRLKTRLGESGAHDTSNRSQRSCYLSRFLTRHIPTSTSSLIDKVELGSNKDEGGIRAVPFEFRKPFGCDIIE